MTDVAMENAADETYDFSDAGLQETEGTFTVTEFSAEKKDNGIQHKITLESPVLNYPVYLNAWVEHTNDKAKAVGRSILKRFALAALGHPSYNQTNIIGARVVATVKEDDNGFTRIGKFKKAAEVEAVS